MGKSIHRRAYPECVPMTEVEQILVALATNMVSCYV
jgi:hypothetical protein